MNDPRTERPGPDLPEPRSSGRRGLSSTIPTGTSRRCAASRWRSRRAISWRSPGPAAAARARCLHLLGGLDRPTAGEVHFRGQPLSRLDLDAFHAREVGFVFQSFHLMPTLTAVENVQIPMFEGPWPRRERRSAGRGTCSARWDCGPRRPPARPALRRRAATGRHRAGTGQRSLPAPGRRADRQPRQQEPGRDPPLARSDPRPTPPHHGDRHAQPRRRPAPPTVASP